VKYLIVNGDDFGASHGVNLGIMEAHQRGILTSTSLMVDTPWSEEAALLSRTAPDLDVGLHVDLAGGIGTPAADLADPGGGLAELERQIRRFEELMGCPPTHLDSHHNVHRNPRLLRAFVDAARRYGLPLRGHSPVRCLSRFYGQWSGVTHLEQISLPSLVRMLEAEVRPGVAELGCHPGYVDPGLQSSYSVEREAELRTLCDPSLQHILTERHIRLVRFRDLPGLELDRSA
jgi:predicted glycoside hydrolase/deacetylase ChbG (UPF0249 family)